ncbi:MAG: hypothetical protein JKY53_12825 [Flavobacteriales bacterium]|nr:hypothetical protein [Flavobacteriales bacterium]
MSEIKSLTGEQRQNLSIFKIQKLKNPKEYGGWSHYIYFWILFPIVALIFGIIGMVSGNEVKKVQGKALLIASVAFILYAIFA